MSRKVKVLVSVLVAVVLLITGTTAAVMAQEEPAPEPEANGLLARVAGILDIPEEDLITAFQQARQEMWQLREDCSGQCEGSGDAQMWQHRIRSGYSFQNGGGAGRVQGQAAWGGAAG